MAQVKVIHDVTACIYKINCDKPVSKWFFQTKLEEQQKDKLVESLKASSGLVKRANELGIGNNEVDRPARLSRACFCLNQSFALTSISLMERPFPYEMSGFSCVNFFER